MRFAYNIPHSNDNKLVSRLLHWHQPLFFTLSQKSKWYYISAFLLFLNNISTNRRIFIKIGMGIMSMEPTRFIPLTSIMPITTFGFHTRGKLIDPLKDHKLLNKDQGSLCQFVTYLGKQIQGVNSEPSDRASATLLTWFLTPTDCINKCQLLVEY